MARKTHAAIDTLFYPFESGSLAWPGKNDRVLFLNAAYHAALSQFKGVTYQQYFKPYADQLEAEGHDASASITGDDGAFDIVLVHAPKNKVEAAYFIAQGLRCLKDGGLIVVAADNKAGGGRLEKMLAACGDMDIRRDVKNKCRVVWAEKENIHDSAVQNGIQSGATQDILDGQFTSQPGVFGWDKIDKGSQILLQHLPEDIRGDVADFGCGYGYLSDYILRHYNVASLSCIDADYRAVELCRGNLERIGGAVDIRAFWQDLTHTNLWTAAFDVIVMNPPFHEGKKADTDIGVAFIRGAHKALKNKGQLWMVANRQLPYEDVLSAQFKSVRTIYEGGGFKVFCAAK